MKNSIKKDKDFKKVESKDGENAESEFNKYLSNENQKLQNIVLTKESGQIDHYSQMNEHQMNKTNS